MDIILTDSLVHRIRSLREKQGNPQLFLRITVDGGGCQGFEYQFALSDSLADNDEVFEKDGVRVVIDPVSLPFLNGSEIDFEENLMGAAFKVNNPNAKSSCGCGTSFSV